MSFPYVAHNVVEELITAERGRSLRRGNRRGAGGLQVRQHALCVRFLILDAEAFSAQQVQEPLLALGLERPPHAIPADLVVRKQLRLIRHDARRHHSKDERPALVARRHHVLGCLRMVAIEAQQLKVGRAIRVSSNVIYFGARFATLLAPSLVTQADLGADAWRQLAAERPVAADHEEGVLGLDRQLHVGILSPPVTDHAAEVANVRCDLLAPGRAVESLDIDGKLAETVRAVIVEKITRLRHLDDERWLHEVTIAQQRRSLIVLPRQGGNAPMPTDRGIGIATTSKQAVRRRRIPPTDANMAFMAKKLITQLIDDLDGTELEDGGESIAFSLEGRAYEIDLS